jgi:hypothetical protein
MAGEDGTMSGSIAAADSDSGPHDANPPRISESTGDQEPAAPRELVREVADSLRSLAKVLPYGEYAAIVHHVARLRWRCGAGAPNREIAFDDQ